MSIESHPSPTGSSSSSLFSGGGGSSGVNETLTQPSPAKPTWAQILNSNPNPSSNSATAGNNNHHTAAGNNTASSSSSPPSQHSASTKTISPSASGTSNTTGSRPAGFMPSFYDKQQQQQQQQSQMNWPINFNQSSSWMMNNDDSQRQPANSSQQSMDNLQPGGGGDGFDRLESSSPTSDWNKPVTTNNSTANGWSNFQQSAPNNPSRSNANSNQWPEINNFYGTNTSTNSFNLPQQNTDNNSSSGGTWQDSSAGNASDTLSLTSSSKHKSSLSGAVKTALALGGSNVDLLSGNGEAMISYVPQPKLVEQLGWDEPEINVIKRGNFDDGTSVWGDPMESMSVPVKKWTNGTKAALTNSTNTISQPQQPPAPQQQQQQVVPKQVPTSSSSTAASQMGLNDENWPKQHPTPTIAPPPISQWNDPSSTSVVNTNNDQINTSQPPNYRPQPTNWNSQNQPSDDWLNGVVDTSDWGLQRSQHKAAFDPYEDQVDTTGWGVQSAAAAAAAAAAAGGMPGQMPMGRNPFMNDYDLNENPRDVRMSGYDNQQINDPYRQNADLKSPMMNLPGMLPSSHHSFPPRPGPLYSSQGGNILRPINPSGNMPTPPPPSAGAMMGQGSHLSPKLPTSSPIPNQAPYAPLSGKQTNIPNQTSQTPTPSQQATGNGSNPNNNNGAVHAQIMQQFRLAVQAGLISQDLLNTKLPPFMLQLLQKLFELQQKFQHLSLELSELTKNKARVPMALLQSEYERLTKSITQKKQEMLYVQKEIQEAHQKLRQQSTNQTSTPTQMMSNGPALQNSDQFRLNQWTKQSTIGQQRTSIFPPPPGLSQKDWRTDNNDPSDSWENSQTHESNNNNNNNPNANNNQIGNVDSHSHMNQGSSSSTFSDPFSNLVDDIDGPPPFVPGQLWNWKSSLPNVEDDPHVTPSSFTTGPKGPGSSMGNLNIGGAESAFSNHQSMHQYQRSLQSNRSQWPQSSLHEQQSFQSPMNDWPKQQQYRGTSKGPPPPPHPGNYRPYM